MGNATLVPDRRRKHFPLNGGPRPTDDEVDRAHRGLEQARRALLDSALDLPDHGHVTQKMRADDMQRGRRAISDLRRRLTKEGTK